MGVQMTRTASVAKADARENAVGTPWVMLSRVAWLRGSCRKTGKRHVLALGRDRGHLQGVAPGHDLGRGTATATGDDDRLDGASHSECNNARKTDNMWREAISYKK